MREPVQSPDTAGQGLPAGAPDNPPQQRPGHGVTQSSKANTPGPRLPHERDESAHDQQPTPATQSEVALQAHADAEAGLPDTSYAQATDAAYHQQVTPGTTTPPPQRTR